MAAVAARTILIVEDNAILREELVALLEEAGFVAPTAQDGREALAYLHDRPPPDVILLDMILPVEDGWRFLAVRSQQPELKAIPVIIMTGLGIASPEWAAALGAQGYLRKPFDVGPLLTEIARATKA